MCVHVCLFVCASRVIVYVCGLIWFAYVICACVCTVFACVWCVWLCRCAFHCVFARMFFVCVRMFFAGVYVFGCVGVRFFVCLHVFVACMFFCVCAHVVCGCVCANSNLLHTMCSMKIKRDNPTIFIPKFQSQVTLESTVLIASIHNTLTSYV